MRCVDTESLGTKARKEKRNHPCNLGFAPPPPPPPPPTPPPRWNQREIIQVGMQLPASVPPLLRDDLTMLLCLLLESFFLTHSWDSPLAPPRKGSHSIIPGPHPPHFVTRLPRNLWLLAKPF
ncbi:hypothetical protein IE53DRAFT_49243 [Violaceomyces palustris]|uniref:Uncharacterized protein n=1 Tax=Violaceomyces palustris TaxID=1673888 RepID=A0ACD0P055_9BASI|nr:hypothetical protein IE53DRAFT_49243 [Violaceomyces palustris]